MMSVLSVFADVPSILQHRRSGVASRSLRFLGGGLNLLTDGTPGRGPMILLVVVLAANRRRQVFADPA